MQTNDYFKKYRESHREMYRLSQRKYVRKNKEKINKASNEWQKKNREKVNISLRKWSKARTAKLKAIVYAHYGGILPSCACCTENNIYFLTLDHINNDGAQHRRLLSTKGGHPLAGMSFYRWIMRNNFPSFFQILCINCNFGKFRNGGICPHNL